MGKICMPKNKSYKTSSYWYPKPVRKSVDKLDRPKENINPVLVEQDKVFERNWRNYLREKGKYKDFEDYMERA